MYILYGCKICGHKEEISLDSLDFGIPVCLVCGNSMQEAEDEDTEEDFIVETIEKTEEKSDKILVLEYMYNRYGNEFTWNHIESIKDYKTRQEYRKVFFAMGGIVPERSISI